MPHFVVGSILGVFYAWPTGPITAGARAVLAAWPVQPSGSCVRWNCLGPGPCPDMILGSILGNQPCFAGCGHWVCHVPGSPKWPLVYTVLFKLEKGDIPVYRDTGYIPDIYPAKHLGWATTPALGPPTHTKHPPTMANAQACTVHWLATHAPQSIATSAS